MAYEIVCAAGVDRDLSLIFDFVVGTAEEFGESQKAAFDLAERRLAKIETAIAKLACAPHQGMLNPHLGDGVRHVTKDRAIFYLDPDEPSQTLRVLAVFFGGQDHDARILLRLLDNP